MVLFYDSMIHCLLWQRWPCRAWEGLEAVIGLKMQAKEPYKSRGGEKEEVDRERERGRGERWSTSGSSC